MSIFFIILKGFEIFGMTYYFSIYISNIKDKTSSVF